MNNQLPNNKHAEQGVLAAILYQPRLISQVADKLKPDDFYYDSLRHKDIYQGMLHLYHQEIEIDTATILAELERAKITEIDGLNALSYISSLWNKGQELPSIVDDSAIVTNCATLRRLYGFIGQAGEVLRDETSAQKALEKVQGLLSSINEEVQSSDLTPLSRVMDAFLADLDTRKIRKGELTGIDTGFDDLNSKLGGLQKGDFYVLGGLPGSGKTSLMLNFLYHILLYFNLYVAVFSIEMTDIDLARRLISMDTRIDSQLLRARWLEDDQIAKVVQSSTDTLYNDHVFIDDSGDLTINAMQTKLDRFKAQHGLDLVIVDYLQLMQSDDERSRENEVAQLSKISRGLKKIAKRFNVPVLALASLNRDSSKRANKRHQLSDLRGCGSIEFDSDVVMFIAQSEERAGYSIVNIEKHRNGPVGDVWLRFNPTLTKFESVDEEEVQA